ncbi:hypothetical protein MHL31_05320 [Lutibacter sp. A80]|uniref:hypothetical protein n=1 Tax=Lutibacter sp. A80 TaxID=2918453 RepID=UPI001F05E58D|nr:hypothetical protein [Lutibacter sp. A80]UMB61626.1 hypothetical protein MHL31_05320 [Lutibacter sp. A80]
MKKIITSVLAITFILLLCASCGSSKGCGLTADTSKVELPTSENNIIAEVK